MGCYLFLTGASMMPGSGNVPFVICTPPKDDKFLKGVWIFSSKKTTRF